MSYPSYKKLKSFQQATTIYDLTVEFVELYIDRKSRTTDQMVQAARSGKQNIAEGSAASKTSPITEVRLLSVAQASLKELLEDYEDFLRQHTLLQWPMTDSRALTLRNLYKSYPTYTAYQSYLSDSEKAANLLITLINQTTFLLDRQIKAVRDFHESRGATLESQQQRLGRLQHEQLRKDQEFDAYLEEQIKNSRTKKT